MQKNIILGLGSNLGKKIDYIRQAVYEIEQNISQVILYSKIYETKALLPIQAPKSWNKNYYNAAILIKSNITLNNLLTVIKAIEKKIGRNFHNLNWSPREIDIDIICYGNIYYKDDNIEVPHKEMFKRNFVLQPLLELVPNWQHPKSKNYDLYNHLKSMPKLKIVPFTIKGSKIMGIYNISVDSFSSNVISKKMLSEKEKMLKFKKDIHKMIKNGAEIIDLGAESTKPKAIIKTYQQTWKDLAPYLEIIQDEMNNNTFPINVNISIDSYHLNVIKNSIKYDCVHFINDVYGFAEKKILKLLYNKNNIKYIFCHNLGYSGNKYMSIYDNPLNVLIKYAHEKINRFLSYGIKKNQLIFDVGIGFGKLPYQSQIIIKNIDTIIKNINLKILVGHSRKQSLVNNNILSNNTSKDIATTLITKNLIDKKVNYIRVHNVLFNSMAKLINI